MAQTGPTRLSTEAFQALFDRCSNWGRWGPDDERGTLNLITPDHRVRAAGLRVGAGDVLLVRTGRWRRRREVGPWDSRAAIAGLHTDCAPWLHERGVALLGFDGISDVLPHAVEGVGLPIHTLTLVAMGMQLLDNQDLEALADACADRRRWEFLLVNCSQSHAHALLD